MSVVLTPRKRPVYVIAHRINDPHEIADALKKGANVLECDVRWGRKTIFDEFDWYVDHDGVFVWSTKLDDWLNEARKEAAAYPQQFAVIFFDIKTPQKLDVLKKRARAKLPADLTLLFSIGDYNDRAAFDPIKKDLGPYDGLVIDADNDPLKVQKYFVSQGVKNFWYGNGIFVAGVGPNVEPSVTAAAQLRDQERQIKKVYVWTLAKEDSIDRYFGVRQVDGVFVNPGTIDEALEIAKKYGQLATRSTPAFAVWGRVP